MLREVSQTTAAIFAAVSVLGVVITTALVADEQNDGAVQPQTW
jgi:hypothetical protein